MKQCSVLVINSTGRQTTYPATLQKVGFRVIETCEWPADETILAFEVVIVQLRDMAAVPMLAARLRAKPHFGHRVLIGITAGSASAVDRRAAVTSGFDDVVEESQPRVMVARILRQLRARPEHRCYLPDLKRRAA